MFSNELKNSLNTFKEKYSTTKKIPFTEEPNDYHLKPV